MSRGAPRATVALAWLLHNPAVTAPIIGVTRSAHLREAIAAVDTRLTTDEVELLERAYTPRHVAGFD